MKRKPVVIVKTGDPVPSVAERRGEFKDLIHETIRDLYAGPLGQFDAREGSFPDPRSAAAFVITGSSANVPNRDAWIVKTETWLVDVVRAGTPTFGICFGHQLLGQALGGKVEKNPRGREIGTRKIVRKKIDDPIFDGLPDELYANVTHIDSVTKLPPGAVALAHNDLEDHHAIRFSETCWGVQFHPEIDADVMRGYVASRRAILEGEGFDVPALEGAIHDAHHGRETLRNFMRWLLR